MQQFRDRQLNPREALTITPTELDHFIDRIRGYLTYMAKLLHRKPDERPASSSQGASGSTTTGPTTASLLSQASGSSSGGAAHSPQRRSTPGIAGLNPSRPSSERRQRVPVPPTSVQPPFLLGVSPPDGVPRQYGEPGLTADQLKQPPAKRRRQVESMTTSTTVTMVAASASSPSAQTVGSTVINRSVAETRPMPTPAQLQPEAPAFPYRCPVADCDFHRKGFISTEALAMHQVEVHEASKETVEDPLGFTLENLATMLQLNADGTMAQEPAPVVDPAVTELVPAGPTVMDATSSRPGHRTSQSQMSRNAANKSGSGTTPSTKVAITQVTSNKMIPTSSSSMATITAFSTENKATPPMRRVDSACPNTGLLTPLSPWSEGSVSLDNLRSNYEKRTASSSVSPRLPGQVLTPHVTPSSGNDNDNDDNGESNRVGQQKRDEFGGSGAKNAGEGESVTSTNHNESNVLAPPRKGSPTLEFDPFDGGPIKAWEDEAGIVHWELVREEEIGSDQDDDRPNTGPGANPYGFDLFFVDATEKLINGIEEYVDPAETFKRRNLPWIYYGDPEMELD